MIPKNQSVLLRYLIRCFCDISIGVFELITNHLVLQVASAGARVVAADSCDTYTVSLWRHPDRGPTSGSQASNNPLPFHREHLNGIQIFSIRIHIQAFLPRHEHLRPHPKDSIQFLKAKVRESFGRYCNCFAHNSNASDVHLFSLEVFFDITLDIVFELLALKNIHVVYESYYEPSGGLAPKDISREYPRISAID